MKQRRQDKGAKSSGNARWEIRDGHLSIALDSGATFVPTAREVFDAVFGSANALRGVPLASHPLEALPDITFSRFALDPIVRIQGALPHPLHLSVGALANDHFRSLTSSDDQVLIEKNWYPINGDALADLYDWLDQRDLHTDKEVSLGQLLALRSSDLGTLLIDESDVSAIGVGERTALTEFNIPGFHGDLYRYQREGISFLKFVSQQDIGCLLADEMGLGKTLQVIALLQLQKNASQLPNLVIAPATIIENWRRECALFAPSLVVNVHTGSDRPGTAMHMEQADVTITSFDTAVRDVLLLESIEWNVVVVDEAQAIKNPDALRSRMIKTIPRRVSIAVTGTPLENRMEDLWSISDFVLPGLLGSRESFRSRFTDDLVDADRLAKIISPVILRRKVKDVAKDLPERIDIPHAISMTASLAKAYEKVRSEALAEYGAAAGMVATTKLRQFCAHPSLLVPWGDDPSHEMPKFERLVEIMDEIFACGEKALIFSTYQAMTDLFMRRAAVLWPRGHFAFIDGRVSIDQRQATVDAFTSHPGFGALFLNPKAAGAGLNITAANHVIHYNPEWNPAVTDQASARAYRRKQKRPVRVHYFYFADTIEEVMLERAGFKRQLADGAVRGHQGQVDGATIMRALQVSPISTGSSPQ